MARKVNQNLEVVENAETKTSIVETEIKKHKTIKWKVLAYNTRTKELDIDFKGYGIRLNNVEIINSDYVDVKYIGEIGKSNFSCEL